MTTIKAPFNFVPLSEKVFFPDWADKISQDIPFEDGESGTIELKITAESPIFVRNGHTKDDAQNKNETYKSFSNIDGKYFIPATSIKGAIRNVLEIISFGKMTQVEDDNFGLRDLSPSSEGKQYRNLMKKQHCGWLQLKNGKYTLSDCGEPGRISLRTIDEELKTKLEEFVKEKQNFRKDSGRTAKAKYIKMGNVPLDGFFENDEDLSDAMKKKNPVDNRLFVRFGKEKKGTIVLTGQSGERKQVYDKKTGKLKWTGKFYEFVFFDKIMKELSFEENDKIIKKFKTVHKNSPDYDEFWGIRLKKGEEIPVFFQFDLENNSKIHSIGLSYLYKYPFKKSVYDGIPDELKNRDTIYIDTCEAIFGHIYSSPLKGRVQFSHGMSVLNTCKEDVPTNTVSSTPHASFYPLYLGLFNGKLQNWNNAERIAGRKRYPIRNTLLKNDSGTENMSVPLIMLKKGAEFSGKIRFHNLRPVEIGALLSAIKFHGIPDCFHSLGYGKPLGYGKVKIEAKLMNNTAEKEKSYIQVFENEMNSFLKSSWINSPQISELLAMAKGIPTGRDNEFEYLVMSNKPEENQFKKAKQLYDSESDYLQSFTQIIKNTKERIQNRDTEISKIENKVGWKIIAHEAYRAFINADNIVCLWDKDRERKKYLRCKYNLSRQDQNVIDGNMVDVKIIKVNDESVDIDIIKIYPPKY